MDANQSIWRCLLSQLANAMFLQNNCNWHLLHKKTDRSQCVKQRAEAMQESSALAKLLPGSQFIVQDYANFGQLKAHGQIARDLTDVRNPMTERLIRFVHSLR